LGQPDYRETLGTFLQSTDCIVLVLKLTRDYAWPMSGLRKCVVYCLLVILPVSSWATMLSPCVQAGDSTLQQSVATDAHAFHGARDNHATESAAGSDDRQSSNTDNASSGAESCCCEGCADACSMSSCSSVAAVATDGMSSVDAGSESLVHADAFRVGSTRGFLFRPPIS